MPSAASGLDLLTSVIQQMARQQRESMDELSQHFSDRTVFLSGERLSDFKRRERLRQKELDNAKKGVKSAIKLNDALEDLEIGVRQGSIEAARATAKVVRQLDELQQSSRTMTQAQRNELNRLQNMARAGQDLSTELLNLRTLTQEVGRQEKERYDKQALIVRYSDRFARSLEEARLAVVGWVKETFTFKNALALMVVGAKQSFDQLQNSLENQIPVMDSLGLGLSGITETAAAYGLTVGELMKVQNTYSQALLASVGTVSSFSEASAQYLQQFKLARDSLYNLTGDYDKASELFASSIDLLSFAGVKQSLADVVDQLSSPGGLADGLRMLATLTNKSSQQLVEMNKAILADRDIRFSMLSLDKQQRRQRLTDMIQYQRLLVSKGMEIDQAIEATRAMEKLTASINPKERYKQAARIRAIAGAQGISGGEDFMRLSMKNPAKWSEQERTMMQSFGTQLEQSLGNLMGSNQLGSQMMGGAFLETIQGSLYDTLVRAQSTAGLEGRALEETTVQNLQQQTTQLQGMQNQLLDLKKVMERIAAWGSDAGVKLAGGTAIGILSGIGTLVGEAAAIIALMKAGGLPGGLGRLASGAKALLKGAAVVGAAVDVGMGIKDLAEGKRQTEMPKGWETISPMRWGMYVGEKINQGLGLTNDDKAIQVNYGSAERAQLVAQEMKNIKNPLTEANEEQKAYLDKIAKTGTPEMKALVEQLRMNNEMMKKMSELMKEGMAADKAAMEATKQNTSATKENTDKSKAQRTILQRAPGVSNIPTGSTG